MLIHTVVLLPAILVLAFFKQPFWHVGILQQALTPPLYNTFLDVTAPRKVRAAGIMLVAAFFPLAGAFAVGFATYLALTPSLLGICSTRDAPCATGARLAAGCFYVLGFVALCFTIYNLPLLHATRKRALPPVRELLRKQFRVTAAGNHQLMYRHARTPDRTGGGATVPATPALPAVCPEHRPASLRCPPG